MKADAAVVPLDVVAQWLAWLDAGEAHRVRADLVALRGATGPPAGAPDPPSSVAPNISTR